jgi:DNA-binding SARP family transcriptional activator
VRDDKGNDITNLFTHILKNFVLAIILNSYDHSPGINTKVLDNLFWPDKDEKSARNNRNVSLNRLNLVLGEIGNIQVVNNNSFLKIEINDTTFCDYLSVRNVMDYPKKQLLENHTLTGRLLELLRFGTLLPFTSEEWLDPYKAQYTDFALDFLLGILALKKTQQDTDLCLQIANMIFLFDSLNEEALIMKCKLLFRQGKKSLAKNAYISFAREYETLLGEKYAKPLSKLIE